MSETPDWKQKYRDSLLEMEAEEQRFRQIEQALRRLVGRLCAAGMGVNRVLDDELVALAAANRRNAAAEELEQLAASLTTAVVAVDAVAPVLGAESPPRAARWESTCAAVAVLLKHLKAADPEAAAPAALLLELPHADADAKLAALVMQAAELVHAHTESLARERLNSAAVLSQVNERLEEMTDYLAESGEAARGGLDATATFNDNVMSEVRGLSAEVNAAAELGALQSRVTARLETVTRHVADFRARAATRAQEHEARTRRMYARIKDLERETLDLHDRLARAQHGARVDPLTGLANRKSFDERFAAELERRAATDTAASLLLWDVDDFKTINDNYGHRAGDRVLKTVANCFATVLRGEHFVARIGGEEFVVVMSGLGAEQALVGANRLRTAVEGLRFHFRGTPVRVTVSCGLTELHRGEPASVVFDRADAALYRAKREGKNLCIAAA